MINHSWRELKARLGWGEGGHLSKLGAGTLTFLAVVVAWVFFRADSFSTAQAILTGMAGVNGVALPPSFEAKLAFVVTHIPQISLSFNGLVSASNISGSSAITSIALGLVLVWIFPNVRQMMRNYKPTWEDMAGRATPALLSEGLIINLLTWKPSRTNAWVMSAIFIACVLSLTKVSEFLYFQF